MRPYRLRPLIIGALIASSVSAAITIFAVIRASDRTRVDADDHRAFVDIADQRAKIEEARLVAKQYAFEGFPAWVVSNPAYVCPQKLAELDVYVGRRDTIDPWGLPFQSYCHSGNTFRVVSAGPDRTHGTFDDIVEGT